MLYDFIDEEPVGAVEHNVDRASLYASAQVTPDSDIQAHVEVAPERSSQGFIALGRLAPS
jgi:hypothetical protein